MKNILHLVVVPFTGLGLFEGYRGDEWYKYRIDIFEKYTLKALKNQTTNNFTLQVCLREAERGKDLTNYLENILKESGLKYIITYGGITFWDDKYNDDKLRQRLSIIIPQLKQIYNDEKYVYETIQPSDDFYHKQAFESIQNEEFEYKKALIHKQGYVFNDSTQTLAVWKPVTNPPFYTIIYPAKIFFNSGDHYRYIRHIKSHEDIIQFFDTKQLPDSRYCVLIHGKNISTTWYHPFRTKTFNHQEAQEIMKDFGIEIGKQLKAKEEIGLIKHKIRYSLLRLFIKGRLYNILKTLKNKYEHISK